MSPIDLSLSFAITSLQPAFRQRLLEAQRMWLRRTLVEQPDRRAIGLIARLETMSFLRFAIAHRVRIEDPACLLPKRRRRQPASGGRDR